MRRGRGNFPLIQLLFWSVVIILLGQVHFSKFQRSLTAADENSFWLEELWPESGKGLSSLNSTTKNRAESIQDSRDYAYVFLLAGCDPDKPAYRGFLFDVLVSADLILREYQSKADVVVMVRMAAETNQKSLPEEAWLRSVGAKIQYLPPPSANETFYSMQLLKFHVLEMTQYKRILYLDSDVMPICNLDYLFDLSVSGSLRENLVIAWTLAPANGGFFMLKPEEGAHERIQQVVVDQRKHALENLPPPHFDKCLGWGHYISEEDPWYTFQKRIRGYSWDFYAGWSDQGLLYHYVKYMQQSVSIVLGKEVQNWVPDTNGTRLDQVLFDPFRSFTCRKKGTASKENYLLHPAYGENLAYIPPFGDFQHFYGGFKPWLGDLAIVSNITKDSTARDYFFFLLRQLNQRISDMNLPLDDADEWKEYAKHFSGGQDDNSTATKKQTNGLLSWLDLKNRKISIHSYYP